MWQLSSIASEHLELLQELAVGDPLLIGVDLDARPVNAWSRSEEELGRQISNFAHTPFTLDGQSYASMEGFYNSLLYLDDERRTNIAQLWGHHAKSAGRKSTLKTTRYQQESIDIGSPAHHNLLSRALQAKFEHNPDLAQLFVDSLPRPVVHDTGRPDRKSNWPHHVFAAELMRARQRLAGS